MSREDVEILRALYERSARGDFASWEKALDPQIVFERVMSDVPPGPGGAGLWRGLDEVRRAIVDWLRNWDEFRYEAEEFIDLGDRVLVLARQTARGRLSGAPVAAELADIVTLCDGRIVRWELYYERAAAKQAAGLE